jgi:uncharacterized membrane protein YqjE
MLERLHAAALLVLQHAGAYTDLIASDVEAAGQGLRLRLWTGAVLAAAIAFAAAMACVFVVAISWNTPARVEAIAGLLAFFVLLALVAYTRLRVLKARPRGLLLRTAPEWEKDRLLLEELLTPGAEK